MHRDHRDRYAYQFERGDNMVLNGTIPNDAEFPDEYLIEEVIKREGLGFMFDRLMIFRVHDNGIDRYLAGDVTLMDLVPGNNWSMSFNDEDIEQYLDLEFAIEKLFKGLEEVKE